MTRLQQQIRFILEADKLKQIVRRTLLTDASRNENAAEHSWQLALMAIVLMEHANSNAVDPLYVIKMLLVHDLVEIDAGDTLYFDHANRQKQKEREARAADRIFKLLPSDQAKELRILWDEFTARQTVEARFANALDRLQPILHGYITHGRMWQKHGVDGHHVREAIQEIKNAAPALHQFATSLIEDAVEKGFLST